MANEIVIKKQFKYLDLVKVVKQVNGTIVLDQADSVDFFVGCIGRLVDKKGAAYDVWIPVPGTPGQGIKVKLDISNIELYKRMSEQDHKDQWEIRPAPAPIA